MLVQMRKLLVYIGIPLVAFLLVTGIALFFIFWYKNPEASPTPDNKIKLVIDHDGGADDALAITMSILYEKYFNGPKVVGLTTCFGNVNLSQAIINSARVLELCDRTDIPIYSGAEGTLISDIPPDHFFGVDGFGDDGYTHPESIPLQNVHAAIGLIELSKRYRGKLIVIAIGPVTNLALAIRLDPDFLGRLYHLYIGAGDIYSEQKPKAEFNIAMDPEAYYIVADSAVVDRVTFVPFSQIFYSLTISNEWREKVLGAIDTPMMKALNGFERVSFASADQWILLDPAVAAIALDESIVDEFRDSKNGVLLCAQRGINTNNFTSTEPNSRVFYSASVSKYQQLLIDIYSAELNDECEDTRDC